jgi:nucleoside-diphosphate-sugar epimerase
VKVLVAGATGAIGRRLVPQLLAGGHEVSALVRSPQSASSAQALGAKPVHADALDPDATMRALGEAAPEIVIHQLTSLPRRIDPRRIERDFVLNDRLRSEGTRHLVAAAQASGVRRVIAQSIAFMYAPGPPGTIHRESDALLSEEQAPQSFRRTARAVRELESSATAPACGRSSTSTTQRRRPSQPWSAVARARTTSSTTSPRACPSGCPRSPRRWVRAGRAAFRCSSRGSPPAATAWPR